MSSIFGFKVMHSGKHIFIAGHVAMKDCNAEFSQAFKIDTLEDMQQGFQELTNQLSSLTRFANCYHAWNLLNREKRLVKCNMCGLEIGCKHDNYLWPAGEITPDSVYECHTCGFTFKKDESGAKVPFDRPAAPVVRPGGGTGSS